MDERLWWQNVWITLVLVQAGDFVTTAVALALGVAHEQIGLAGPIWAAGGAVGYLLYKVLSTAFLVLAGRAITHHAKHRATRLGWLVFLTLVDLLILWTVIHNLLLIGGVYAASRSP